MRLRIGWQLQCCLPAPKYARIKFFDSIQARPEHVQYVTQHKSGASVRVVASICIHQLVAYNRIATTVLAREAQVVRSLPALSRLTTTELDQINRMSVRESICEPCSEIGPH
jgi:hypothetical protein